MSTAANSYYFRRRTIGRAASPPTWACYEQIHHDDSDSNSESDSCSEDDEDYPGGVGSTTAAPHARDSDSEDNDSELPSHTHTATDAQRAGANADSEHDIDMDIDEEGDASANKKKDVKGKQRAVEPEPLPEPTTTTPRRQRKKRPHVYTLRPILTIQRSQGFVWNQVRPIRPPYIKDRYIASTSPPNSRGFISSSVGSNNSAMTDYEVEVVEIRVNPGDLDDIIP
ncbi:hypothetical protein CPB84DRAFT_1773991 [Gymnopilus junonius]|uniref:Uncharacterized protein n=1 Tax=Gymnopilus junonius TaxID=109634 RepID=A0A9P5TPR5_GYMJU|nr:hypothetical protein CPB84DRAFT_1773991 [Gymnopilus junonius]